MYRFNYFFRPSGDGSIAFCRYLAFLWTMHFNNLFLLIALAFLPASCAFMENPEGDGAAPTDVSLLTNVSIDIGMPGAEARLRAVNADGFCHRVIIEATNEESGKTVRKTFYRPVDSQRFEQTLIMRLRPQKHKLLIWSDYAPDGGNSPFYTTRSLHNIERTAGAEKLSELKDCFFSASEFDLSPYAGQRDATAGTKVVLERPVGRYELIATDVSPFVEALESGSITGSKFKARISCAGACPKNFSVATGLASQPADHVFEVPIEITDGQEEMTVAYDYLLLNQDIENKEIHVEIVNEHGLVQTSTTTTIPMERNLNTVVRGSFLSNTLTGGIVIDPSFDGEFDVDLGDI